MLGDPDLVLVPGGGWNDRGGPGACARGAARRDPGRAARAPRGRPARRLGLHRRDAARRGGHPHGPPRDHAPQRHEDLRAYGVDVVDGARFVDEGDIITSAGVTAGIDMALHLVDQALGARPPRRPPTRSSGTASRCDPELPVVRKLLVEAPRPTAEER